jgi:hypothetical protein
MVMVKNNGLMVMMMMQKRKRRREMVTFKATKTPMGELQISSNLTSVTASDLRQGVKLMTQDEKHMGTFPPNCTCIQYMTSTHAYASCCSIACVM